jgi:hypothetical protein
MTRNEALLSLIDFIINGRLWKVYNREDLGFGIEQLKAK